MIKVADIDISKDNCGLYTVLLKGSDAQFFRILNNELWFILSQPNICKSTYTVTVSVEDLAGRFTPKTATYTLNAINCACTSTTTTTSTTIMPTTTTTTTTFTSTTTGSPQSSTCPNFLSYRSTRSGEQITNLVNYGTYFIGDVTGATNTSTVWGDNIHGYTDDSNFSRAAVHAGLLGVGQTKTIKFTFLGQKTNFPSSFANNVQTSSWPTSWCAVQLSLA
jgi:hypothetical protein